MWELDHKISWVPKNWCFGTVVLEKTLESPLDCKIKPINSKRNQPWLFTGRANAEAPILWPPDVKSQVTGKDPDAGKHGRQKQKAATNDEMVREHHRLNGYEFEQIPEDSEGQGNLACCSPWSPKESNTTYQVNNNNEGRNKFHVLWKQDKKLLKQWSCDLKTSHS